MLQLIIVIFGMSSDERNIIFIAHVFFHSTLTYKKGRNKMRFPAWFNDTLIRQKFIFIAFLATGAAVVFAILLSTFIHWFMLRETLVENVSAQASIIAANSTESIVSNNHEKAETIVKALANIKNIEFAGILDRHGKNFALYVRPGVIMPPHKHHVVENEYHIHTARYIEIVIPVVFNKEHIGMIHVRASMNPVYTQLGWDILVSLSAAAGAFLTAVFMIFRLLPAITNPLHSLIGVMKRVSRDNDFSLRSSLHSHDEIGTLAHGFNSMLAQIQSRDGELKRYREHLEEEIALRTDRLTEAHRIAHLGNWEWDILNNTLSWSDEIYRIFGFTPQQFEPTYESFMQSVHPEDRQSIETAIREAFEGNPYSIDHRILLPDGTIRHVHEHGKLIRNEEDQPIKMLGTVQDITERKQVEQILEESEYRFRTILDVAVDGVLLADAQTHKFIQANHAICEMLGYQPNELYQLGVEDIHPTADLPKVQQQFDRQMKGEIRVAQNLPVKRKDGSIFFADVSSAPMTVSGQTIMVGFFHDVTERKQAEEEIHLLATTDSLTGIANRRAFNAQLLQEIERAKRYGTPLSLVMYDIDYFKRVNDTFGHDTGDAVLQALTRIVKTNVRSVDIVARWGGEEFMILMPQSDVEAAADAADKLRQKVVQHPFEQVGSLTVSFGVTAFTPKDDLDTFLKRVDNALYQAKEKGRNRVEKEIEQRGPEEKTE